MSVSSLGISLTGLLAAGNDGTIAFPSQGSTVAPAVDSLFYIITAISAFFFVLIVAVMIYFVVRYRRRPGHDVEKSPSHNTALEITWSVIPGLLLVYIFAQGFLTFLDMRKPPEGAYEIQVVGRKWSWAFQYPNGVVQNELHLPLDRPVRLVMSSEDVIHSLFIPAFRVKQDLVPGRYSKVWFRTTKPGEYRLYCAEYCGQQHSTMVADVIVHEAGEFEPWLQAEVDRMNDLPPAELGELLYQRQGCVQCHAIDNNTTGKVGPSFLGTFGTEQPLADGQTVTVDENYIRQSILDPVSQVRAGYQPVMPTYQGRLKDREINALVEFIKSLGQ
ncbi:Cytochrome c oxidase subunit 2 precursor [Maioricimonas rarisocia]|uniref:Cytochrome c oxidase subunit 2 n=1 Tax=Maioricimonas rarisocia TaxID=2528026 RepID=A0A517ZFA8_9PLAN|nr:cytochrome c oxidase subunit II [Maioricimonas rarisocia]QDU41177.1 Cytochrome c oxidase subunit 2 precursor [Maioricimonas rarisocia]